MLCAYKWLVCLMPSLTLKRAISSPKGRGVPDHSNQDLSYEKADSRDSSSKDESKVSVTMLLSRSEREGGTSLKPVMVEASCLSLRRESDQMR
jgi:hypothetical protein